MLSRAWIALPTAPDEYDFEAVIERSESDQAILFGMKAQNKLFHVGLDVHAAAGAGRWSGLDLVNGKNIFDAENPTRIPGPKLINGKKHTLRCQVRAMGIAATLDGQRLFNYQGGYDKIHGSNNDPADAFFVFAYSGTRYVVHRLVLTPHSPPAAANTNGWVH